MTLSIMNITRKIAYYKIYGITSRSFGYGFRTQLRLQELAFYIVSPPKNTCWHFSVLGKKKRWSLITARPACCAFTRVYLYNIIVLYKRLNEYNIILHACVMMRIRTHTRVEPKHPLPPHAVVELGRRRVLARAIRPQHCPQYTKNGLATRGRRSRTPAGCLVHRTRLFESFESRPA